MVVGQMDKWTDEGKEKQKHKLEMNKWENINGY